MTQSLDDIRQTIRDRGNLRNTVRWPNATIEKEAQAAFKELYGLVVLHSPGFYDTDTDAQGSPVHTVANQAYAPLPTGTWAIRAVDLLDGGEYVPLEKVGNKDRNRYGTANRDKPRAYRRSARGIELFPTPNAVYTLRITYTPVAPQLDSSQREYYVGWEEYVVAGALIRLCGTQHTDAKIWLQTIAATEARIISEAGEANTQGPEYLNLFGDGDGIEDWDRPVDWSWR